MKTELQQLNVQSKVSLWAERITECQSSGLSVKKWCKEKGICEANYYKWQKKIFEMVKAQQEPQFAEITPVMEAKEGGQVAVSIRAGEVSADVHNGAAPSTDGACPLLEPGGCLLYIRLQEL